MAISLEAALTGLVRRPFEAHELIFSHKVASAPFHRDMVELYWGDAPRVALECFRGSAKSTRAEEAIALQAQFKRFNYAVILGANEDRACDRLMTVKYHLETNDQLRALFGEARGGVWQATRAVLKNGTCIDAIGAGQSLLGMKYLEDRPEYAFCDDLEEMSRYLDNVSTPEKRRELAKWFYATFLPALAKDGKVRMAGTPFHEESLIATAARSPDWKSLSIPIEYLTEAGERASSWPAKYTIAEIDRLRGEYAEANQLEAFGQQYLCRATAPEARSFRSEMFRFEDRVRTWEPVYVIYDPARTVGPQSCATGKVAASWVGGRLLVWEATANFWQPDELIGDVFEADDRYTPVAVGIEKTGLSLWIEQPLRNAQMARGHPVPIRSLEPPRGPGKDKFIETLQPYFANGEVIFCGRKTLDGNGVWRWPQFDALIKELLGFPYGQKDTMNALAYMTEIKPGVPIYEQFCQENIADDLAPSRRANENFLLLNSDTRSTCGILVSTRHGGLSIVADWLESGDPGGVLDGMCAGARALVGGKPLSYAGARHFEKYDTIGLRAAASTCGLQLMRGGDLVAGREEIRRLMTLIRGNEPLLKVSKAATWTLRALSGGYCRDAGKTEANTGGYKVVGEALEMFGAILAMGGLDDDKELSYGQTKDGRRFLSAAGKKP